MDCSKRCRQKINDYFDKLERLFKYFYFIGNLNLKIFKIFNRKIKLNNCQRPKFCKIKHQKRKSMMMARFWKINSRLHLSCSKCSSLKFQSVVFLMQNFEPPSRPAWTKFETIAHTIEAIKKVNEEKAAISASSILYQINDNQPNHGPMKVRLSSKSLRL